LKGSVRFLLVGVFILGMFWGVAVAGNPNVAIYAYNSEMITLDPSTEFSNSVVVLANLYECLVKYTPSGLKPWLAVSWEALNGGKEWVFHLRRGVKFHSGNEMTAKDVKWSVERTIKMGGGAAFIWDPVKKVEVVDRYTVKFVLKYAANLPLIASAGYGAYIMDSKTLSEIGDNKAIAKYLNKGHEAGSGPYTLVKYNPKTEIIMKKFNDYWGGWKKGQIDIAVVKVVPDASLREQMVISGQAQITRDLPIDDIPKLEDNKKVTIKRSLSYQELYGMLNTQKKPLNNKLVRKALSYATPYEKILKYILHDYGVVANGPIPKGMFGYFQDMKGYSYDISKAKQLLSKAGYAKGGIKLLLTYMQGDSSEKKVAEILKAEWKKIGVDLEIKAMNWEQQWALAKSDPSKAQDVLVFYWWPTYATPYDFLFNMFHSEKTINFNLCYYRNPNFDKLIDEAVALEGTDVKKSSALYRKAEEILLDDAPAIFFYSPDAIYVVNRGVKGFKANPGYTQVVFFYQLFKR